jgi:uncharacterized membrane protein YiaA
MRSGRRLLLLAVAALLSASALLAIGILLVGHFGTTEGRILASTALLAGFGLVALPSTVLFDQGRSRRLALAGVALAVAGALVALVGVWSGADSPALGKTIGSVAVFALAAAQVSAVTARRRERDPRAVRRLFAISCGLAAVLAAAIVVAIWAEPGSGLYPRLVGALAVLDLLVVALQPILARARPRAEVYRLRVVVEGGETVETSVEAGDLATAAATAIRALERDRRHIVRLEVGAPSGSVRED